MTDRMRSNPWQRAMGGWAARERPSRHRARFDALTAEADQVGVPWRDLLGDAYRAPGDMAVAGVMVSYDWRWRADEVERRLALRRQIDESPDGPGGLR